MMCRGPLLPRLWGVALIHLLTAMMAGCGVLNPSLVGTVAGSSAGTLEPPQGTILISVFNTTTSIAAARFEITKKNGGVLNLVIPVQPADNNPANEADHGTVIQDCDVQSIRLAEVLASVPGGVQQFGTGLAPLEDGLQLSCGKSVVVTIVGTPPNLLATLNMY
ncbi:MAG TPA: hypothetical protein VLM89_05240 [Phycisphaerae bacterium]|nr:hypothetical protein [Phycisphaerae bacterium]